MKLLFTTFILALLNLLETVHSQGVNQCNSTLKQALLDPIAVKRRLHSARPVTLEEYGTLEAYSQAWADNYAGLNGTEPPINGSLNFIPIHFAPSTYWDPQSAARDIVKWVYKQSLIYTWYGQEPPVELHDKYYAFTQLVWRGSSAIGVACAAYVDNDFYHSMVITFRPAGNIEGQYAENVLAPLTAEELNSKGEKVGPIVTEKVDPIVTEKVDVVTKPTAA